MAPIPSDPRASGLTFASDLGGSLNCVAVQINSYLLDSAYAPRRRAYENLLRSFPAGVRVLAFVDPDDVVRARRWIDALSIAADAHVLAAPSGALRGQGAWMRDAFLNARRGDEPRLIATHTQRPAGQARWLAHQVGAHAETCDVSLEGGDCLVADDVWIVGAQAVRNTRMVAGRRCEMPEAVRRLASLDSRPMRVAGYPRDPEDLAAHAVGLGLEQDWAHIDLVMSVTGRHCPAGKPLLMIADPAHTLCRPDASATWAAAPLNAMARHLERQGFAILRNPSPFAGNPRRLAAYNNVILQRGPDIVWLPQFADAGAAFAASDLANAMLWEGLGYRVIPVEGWGAFLPARGSIRCATNVVARHPLAKGGDRSAIRQQAA